MNRNVGKPLYTYILLSRINFNRTLMILYNKKALLFIIY